MPAPIPTNAVPCTVASTTTSHTWLPELLSPLRTAKSANAKHATFASRKRHRRLHASHRRPYAHHTTKKADAMGCLFDYNVDRFDHRSFKAQVVLNRWIGGNKVLVDLAPCT